MLEKIQSDQINELAGALAKAQSEIMPALKDSKNPFFKSTYADLASIWSACKDPLSKNGLAIIQTMDVNGDQHFLITTLAHASGQWIRSYLPIINEKQNAQGFGSAITYMRRYALSAIVGVTADEDDDGNAACKPKEAKRNDPLHESALITQFLDKARFSDKKAEYFRDYVEFVRGMLKDKNLSEVIQGWLKDPKPCLDYFGKWMEKNSYLPYD